MVKNAPKQRNGRCIERTKGMNKPIDRRLLTMTQAAKELNVSRMTIRRMCNDGRLPVVETRAGRRWIPNTALTNLVKGARKVVKHDA